MSKATTLDDAYNILDSRKPLTVGQLPTLFVERAPKNTRKFIRDLINAKNIVEGKKFLYIGHRGSGKSTELRHLTEEDVIKTRYHAVHVSLFSIFKQDTLTRDEMMFAVFTSLLRDSVSKEFVSEGILTQVWVNSLEGLVKNLHERLFGIGKDGPALPNQLELKLDSYLGDLEVNVASNDNLRNQLANKTDEFRRNIATVIRQIEATTQSKKVLLVIEDIDKFNLKSAESLFVDYASALLLIPTTTIFTFPIGLRYSDTFEKIQRSFSAYTLPNLPTTHRNGQPDDDGRAKLRSILMRRVADNLIAEDAVERMVDWSGGVVQMMIELAHSSVLEALTEEATQVQLNHVQEAFRRLCILNQGMFTPADYDQAAGLPAHERVAVKNTPQIQRWLNNGMLIEYENSLGNWCDISPWARQILTWDEKLNQSAAA